MVDKSPSTHTPSPTDPGWFPECYALRVTASRCSSCGEVHFSSRLWLVYGHMVYTNAKRERVLGQEAELHLSLPVVKFEQHESQRACHLCVDNLSTLGIIQPPQVMSESSWRAALTASAKARKTEVLRASKPQPVGLKLGDIF